LDQLVRLESTFGYAEPEQILVVIVRIELVMSQGNGAPAASGKFRS